MADPVTISMIATGVGTAISAGATLAGGSQAKQAGKFAAAQLDQNAGQTRAAAQRRALERRRDTNLAQSTLQARAAASGGGADDPGVLGLAGNIAQRGEYQALTEMAIGENQARGLEDQAMAARISADQRLKAARLKALGTIIGGAGSMFGKFGTPGASTMPISDPWMTAGGTSLRTSYG